MVLAAGEAQSWNVPKETTGKESKRDWFLVSISIMLINIILLSDHLHCWNCSGGGRVLVCNPGPAWLLIII